MRRSVVRSDRAEISGRVRRPRRRQAAIQVRGGGVGKCGAWYERQGFQDEYAALVRTSCGKCVGLLSHCDPPLDDHLSLELILCEMRPLRLSPPLCPLAPLCTVVPLCPKSPPAHMFPPSIPHRPHSPPPGTRPASRTSTSFSAWSLSSSRWSARGSACAWWATR